MNDVQGFIIGMGLMIIVYIIYMAWHQQEFYNGLDLDDEDDSEFYEMGMEDSEDEDKN